MAQTYVAAGVPARLVRVSNTTLFRLAADYLGDPMLWTRIARINGLVDPWIGDLREITIPTPMPVKGEPSGILGG